VVLLLPLEVQEVLLLHLLLLEWAVLLPLLLLLVAVR